MDKLEKSPPFPANRGYSLFVGIHILYNPIPDFPFRIPETYRSFRIHFDNPGIGQHHRIFPFTPAISFALCRLGGDLISARHLMGNHRTASERPAGSGFPAVLFRFTVNMAASEHTPFIRPAAFYVIFLCTGFVFHSFTDL